LPEIDGTSAKILTAFGPAPHNLAEDAIAAHAAAKPDAKEDKADEIPEELKAQLRQLGYMQ
jgi:hypothetical protein